VTIEFDAGDGDRERIAHLYRVGRILRHVATDERVVIDAEVPRRVLDQFQPRITTDSHEPPTNTDLHEPRTNTDSHEPRTNTDLHGRVHR
jgi:hypothetical protein